MKRLTIQLNEGIMEKLKIWCIKKGKSLRVWVTEAVMDKLKNEGGM